MSAANTLSTLFRLLNRNKNVIPSQKSLKELSDYADYIDVNPDKAVEALKLYMTQPDTNELLHNFARSRYLDYVDYDNPRTLDILGNGWETARYMAPQFRNYFRRSQVIEPDAPVVKMADSPALTVPEIQYQGAGVELDYIDDALRDLTATSGRRQTGIWTGTPHTRALEYARMAAPDGGDGVVNDLFVRMERPLILDAQGKRWFGLRDATVDRKSLPSSMEKELTNFHEEAAAELWNKMPEDSRRRVQAYNEASENYFHWLKNDYKEEVKDELGRIAKEYKDDPWYNLLEKELGKSNTSLEDVFLNKGGELPDYVNEVAFDIFGNLQLNKTFDKLYALDFRKNNAYEGIQSALEKDILAENYVRSEMASLASGDTLLEAMLRGGFKNFDLNPSSNRLPKVNITTNEISKFIKNDIDDVADGVIMNNIRDGTDVYGRSIISRNVVPNTNEQVKRASGNTTFSTQAKEWSKGIAGAGTAGYLGSKMMAPTDAQASVRLPSPSQGLGESWNPIESMLVGAGTGALAGAGAAGVGAIPGAVGGALGGLIFDGLMEAGVPYVYNNYIEPNAKEYAKNFVFTPPVLED